MERELGDNKIKKMFDKVAGWKHLAYRPGQCSLAVQDKGTTIKMFWGISLEQVIGDAFKWQTAEKI